MATTLEEIGERGDGVCGCRAIARRIATCDLDRCRRGARSSLAGGGRVRVAADARRARGSFRIAVLPFENEGRADDDYFADGMTDEVRSRLSSIRGSAGDGAREQQQYKKSTKELRDIGRELEVQYLLTGTVRWSKGNGPDRVRVTPELVEVSNDRSKWSEPYDTVMSDVFEVQAAIASHVAEADRRAGGADAAAARGASDGEPRRVRRIPEGRADHGERRNRRFEGAQRRDPALRARGPTRLEFPRGLVALARALAYINNAGPTSKTVERNRVAAERALVLGPNRAEGHLAMAAYLRDVKLDYEGARRSTTRGSRRTRTTPICCLAKRRSTGSLASSTTRWLARNKR